MQKLLKKTLSLLEKLSSKPRIDGLEIHDGGLEYVFLEEQTPRTAAVRLPPGVLENGKLKNPEQFSEALDRLHAIIAPHDPGKVLRVTIVLPEGLVYTQSFEIPNVGEEKLEEAVTLNLQMISPMPIEEANMSAQIVSETQDQYELMGAFANRASIMEFKNLLAKAHFAPIAFECSAFALTRLVRRLVKREVKSVLLLEVSSDGISLYILRDGTLHFSYFRSWQSIRGDARSIPRELFDAVMVQEVQKVVNFAVSKFGEGPGELWLMAGGFEKEVAEVLEKNFPFKIFPFVLGSYPGITQPFYTSLGAAFRNVEEEQKDGFTSINLGGEDLSKTLKEEQVLNFIVLWRNIVVGVLAIMLAAFGFSAAFLVKQSKLLSQTAFSFTPGSVAGDYAMLSERANEFNKLVGAIQKVKDSALPWESLLSHLFSVMGEHQIALGTIEVQSLYDPIRLGATAPDYQTVTKFKTAISNDPKFKNIDLPLTQITASGDNSVLFNVTFQFTP